MADKRQLVVIGGGPGGYAAAFYAADKGMKVTLIDPDINPGGVCLYRGCIPSKALLHVARLISEAGEAKVWGVEFSEPKINLKKLNSWKNGVIDKLTRGLGQLCVSRKIEYIRGKAVFVNNQTLEVKRENNKTEKLTFEHAILAAGSIPATIPSLPVDARRVLNSTSALEIDEIPKTLLVVGGGYIGLELGTVYAVLGSKVTVVEMLPGLLPGADRDLVAPLERRLQSLFDAIFLNTRVADMKIQKNGCRVALEGKDTGKKEKLFDKVLIAVGRKPNSSDLGLQNTKIETDERGFIKINDQRRTAEQSIYAIGDIAGEPMLAHKASHEAKVAVDAAAGGKAVFEPRAIPAVVFTDPEIAWCGLTETRAKENKKYIEVARFPWGASGRAVTLGRSDGLTKLIIDPETNFILGVGITGPGAGNLISEGVLAVEMAANVRDLELTIHPHPTLSETIMETAGVFLGQSTHLFRPKRRA